ncbi:hypothetical protein [Leptospirillum ferriphilum]|uniref:Accessory factor UbiK family protein n=2 Tax=Leptospirillum ferriphilum TaxID=178606 RepID=A0A059XVF1_9BACT|nr:hypothetical protein [Leptospirillum ferriphilum]AIA31100.1 hypothetical protein Y981_11235 [Leptospirillum ferriphilum YSK]OOH73973.1 hypothetical protein BOX24_02985 [Leptospirillum ferriphilum]
MASSIEAIQKILQETIAPSVSRIEIELAGVKADIKSLQSEIKRLDDKIDNVKEIMASGFARQAERMDHLEDNLKTAIEIRERLAALEGRAAAR